MGYGCIILAFIGLIVTLHSASLVFRYPRRRRRSRRRPPGPKTPRSVLMIARKLIADPTRWIKGHEAKNVFNEPVHPKNILAKCWCLSGAIIKATEDGALARAARDALTARLPSGFCRLTDFNDDPETTHADILALFDSPSNSNPR